MVHEIILVNLARHLLRYFILLYFPYLSRHKNHVRSLIRSLKNVLMVMKGDDFEW